MAIPICLFALSLPYIQPKINKPMIENGKISVAFFATDGRMADLTKFLQNCDKKLDKQAEI